MTDHSCHNRDCKADFTQFSKITHSFLTLESPPVETTYLRPEYYMQKKSHITSRKLSRRAVFLKLYGFSISFTRLQEICCFYLNSLQRDANISASGFTTSCTNARACGPPLAAYNACSKDGFVVS